MLGWARAAGQVRSHHFECDGLLELPVGAPCQVHPAHAAATQQALSPIGPDAQPRTRQLNLGAVSGSGVSPSGRGLRAELAMSAVRGEKRQDLFPNRRIESGLRSEPRLPFRFGLL